MADAPEAHSHSDLEVAPSGQQKLYADSNVNSSYPLQSPAPQYEHANGGYYVPADGGKRERTICGVRPATFFLSLALLLVILAAGIGGGVSGSMAVKNAKNSATSSTPATVTVTVSPTSTSPPSSTSTSSLVVVPTNGSLPLDCPNLDNTNLRIPFAGTTYLYQLTCGADFGQANGLGQQDIVAIAAYSLHDCAMACSSYNHNYGSNACKGATFSSSLGSIAINGGTCWLKNYTSGETQGTSNKIIGMILQ